VQGTWEAELKVFTENFYRRIFVFFFDVVVVSLFMCGLIWVFHVPFLWAPVIFGFLTGYLAWLLFDLVIRLPVGTKSVLFGAHAFWLHPWFVAEAWRRLYGFPRDPRLWIAFFVHDLGYWGKKKMDNEEGERHPKLGADIMGWLFDRDTKFAKWFDRRGRIGPPPYGIFPPNTTFACWSNFTYYHSRFLAKRHDVTISQLCVADKLSIVLTPWWVYGPMAKLSGELAEYLEAAQHGKYKSMNLRTREGVRIWHREMQIYLFSWVQAHKDTLADTWTPEVQS
jgi:hypothetical protein